MIASQILRIALLVCFLSNLAVGPNPVFASEMPMVLPRVGAMVNLSKPYSPINLAGLKVNPHNPTAFDYIIDLGDDTRVNGDSPNQEVLKKEADKLIKYFFAGLALPENDLWVNLSPYEKDHIIPATLGNTELGRDMLAQDYMLKQITASMMYPNEGIGKIFWERIYAKVQAKYGHQVEVPVNTFNKVWIVPQTADIYTHDNVAYIMKSHLKVMLEEDYLAMQKNSIATDQRQKTIDQRLKENDLNTTVETQHLASKYNKTSTLNSKIQPLPTSHLAPITKQIIKDILIPATHRKSLDEKLSRDDLKSSISSSIIREIIIPALEIEINEGKNFALLRQIYHALILSTWYKQTLKNSLINKVYANKNKIKGVDLDDKKAKERIYAQYLAAYKKGVFNIIKEDVDKITNKPMARKYFSGGEVWNVSQAMQSVPLNPGALSRKTVMASARVSPQSQAMIIKDNEGKPYDWKLVDDVLSKIRIRLDGDALIFSLKSKSIMKEKAHISIFFALVRLLISDNGGNLEIKNLNSEFIYVRVGLKSTKGINDIPGFLKEKQREITTKIEDYQNILDYEEAFTFDGRRVLRFELKEMIDRYAAWVMIKEVQKNNQDGKFTPFILPTGSTPEGVYREFVHLAKLLKLDLSRIITFNMDEYFVGPNFKGKWREHPQSYWAFMKKNLFHPLLALNQGFSMDNVNFLDGQAADIEAEVRRYENKIAAVKDTTKYGKFIKFGGIGTTGHLAFNEARRLLRNALSKIVSDSERLAAREELARFNEFIIDQETEDPIRTLKDLLLARDQVRHSESFKQRLKDKVFEKRTELLGNEWVEKAFEKWFKKIQNQPVIIHTDKIADGVKEQLKSLVEHLISKRGFGTQVIFQELKAPNESKSRHVHLALSTIEDNSKYFRIGEMPLEALTIGLGTLIDGGQGEVIIMAKGDSKARTGAETLTQPPSYNVPASLLRGPQEGGPQVTYVVDARSGAGLASLSFTKKVIDVREEQANRVVIATPFKLPSEREKRLSAGIDEFWKEQLGLDANDPKRTFGLQAFLNQPTGKEQGYALGVDFSGTNIRVSLYYFGQDGSVQTVATNNENWEKLDKGIKSKGKDVIFGRVATIINKVLFEARKNDSSFDNKAAELDIPIGFSFAFPLKQQSATDAVITEAAQGNKNWAFEDLMNENLATFLDKKIKENSPEKGAVKTHTAIVLNDTVATQLSRLVKTDRRALLALLGVISGTGFNFSFMLEKLEQFLNAEAGGMGATFLSEFLQEEDRQYIETLPRASRKVIIENMITGDALPQLWRLRMLNLLNEDKLFKGNTVAKEQIEQLLRDSSKFNYKVKDAVLKAKDVLEIRQALLPVFRGLYINDVDIKIIQGILQDIYQRSAQLLALVLSKAINLVDPNLTKTAKTGSFITLDGSGFWQTPGFKEMFKEELERLMPNLVGKISFYDRKAQELLESLVVPGHLVFVFVENATTQGSAYGALIANQKKVPPSRASIAQTPTRREGGIDFKAERMAINSSGDMAMMDVPLDPATLAIFEQGQFAGITPRVVSIVRVKDLLAVIK